jgi:hypothetical protein
LTELTDRVGLTAGLSEATAPTRERRSAHDPGVVLRDLIVAIADGGDCVTDLGVLRDQGALFGPVASERTAHRAIKSIDANLAARRDLDREILVRTDIGGRTHAFTSDCREAASASPSAMRSKHGFARRSCARPSRHDRALSTARAPSETVPRSPS